MGFYSLLCVHVLLSNQFLCFLQPFTDDTFIFPEIMPTANSLLKFLQNNELMVTKCKLLLYTIHKKST